MGTFNLQNSNYGFFMNFKNCTFSFNAAQFGGVLAVVANAKTPLIVNISNTIFLSNNASKENTYLGLDYSQGGVFTGINNENTSIYISNSFVLSSYARKGN